MRIAVAALYLLPVAARRQIKTNAARAWEREMADKLTTLSGAMPLVTADCVRLADGKVVPIIDLGSPSADVAASMSHRNPAPHASPSGSPSNNHSFVICR